MSYCLDPCRNLNEIERIFPLHIFAHFLHIVGLEIGCKAVHRVQRMQWIKIDKTTVIG